MTILARYILKQVFPPFIFGFSVVVFLFLMQFLMNHLHKLVGKGLSEWVIIQLIVYNMSWMMILAVPMGVLFATLLGFGSMAAAHEITIMKASGGSLLRAMRPVVIASLFVTYGLFWFNDVVLPESNHRAKILMGDIQRKKPTFSLESGKFSSEMDGHTIMARHVDSLSGALHGVTIYKHDKVSEWNVISSDSGTIRFSSDFEKLIVDLYKGEIHQFRNDETKNYKIINFDEFTIQLNASGFAFNRTNEETISRGDREQSISDMQSIVNKSDEKIITADSTIEKFLLSHWNFLMGMQIDTSSLKNSEIDTENLLKGTTNVVETFGIKDDVSLIRQSDKRISFLKTNLEAQSAQIQQYDKRKRQYQVEIQKKYAIPMACLLFVFVGSPLGIITRGGNFGFSAAISLAFYIFYWACLIGGEKLADRGLMSPYLSMWIGNFIIAVFGLLITLRVNNESFRFFSK